MLASVSFVVVVTLVRKKSSSVPPERSVWRRSSTGSARTASSKAASKVKPSVIWVKSAPEPELAGWSSSKRNHSSMNACRLCLARSSASTRSTSSVHPSSVINRPLAAASMSAASGIVSQKW